MLKSFFRYWWHVVLVDAEYAAMYERMELKLDILAKILERERFKKGVAHTGENKLKKLDPG